MTKFDLRTLTVSSLGALALSAACVGAAVAPARAEAPAGWQQVVGGMVSSRSDILAPGVQPGRVARPEIALRFDADGRFAGAAVARSSGNAAADAEALLVARQTRYPLLPAAWRGAERTVTLRLAVGAAEDMGGRPLRTGRATVAARGDAFQVAGR